MNSTSQAALDAAKSELTPSQIKGIEKIVLGYERRNAYTKVTEVDLESVSNQGSFVSFAVHTRRTDCEASSHRQIICRQGGHFFVGRGGKLEMMSNYEISRDFKMDRKKDCKRELASLLINARHQF